MGSLFVWQHNDCEDEQAMPCLSKPTTNELLDLLAGVNIGILVGFDISRHLSNVIPSPLPWPC